MGSTLKNIASILSLTGSDYGDQVIEYLVTDSRKLIFPEHSLFFAIKGPRRSGTYFIPDLYHRGVRYFLIDEDIDQSLYPSAIFLQVPNSIKALQQIAAYHRQQFLIPVIGITGSNGKTIVKEWLYQLLSPDFNIVRSPRSYNSQIGVPLSIWQMNTQHTLAIFEAGISTKGEMDALANMIQPTIGVLTNIGEAHNEGFASKEEKLAEKLRFFKSSESNENALSIPLIVGTDIVITEHVKFGEHTKVKGHYLQSQFEFTIPFTDAISIQNTLTCCAVMMKMGYAAAVIQERITQLVPVEMRMQLRKGMHNSFVLNDSYSNDLASLALALPYLKEQSGEMATSVILSDIVESGKFAAELYGEVVKLLSSNQINKLYAIGTAISNYFSKESKAAYPFTVECFSSTEAFLTQVNTHQFQQQYVLLKGARLFEFEQIAHWLEQQVHQTVLEINLTAMVQNLKLYQSLLKPSTKLMAMVKAFSYGSGAGEVAKKLQQQQIDYLAVAYADEGIALRKAGINLPIMVMSPDEHSFDSLINYNLEPEIFSFELLHRFKSYLVKEGLFQFPIHIKLNTGMNRLGFEPTEITALITELTNQQQLMVKSVMSHLVASEDPMHDEFTKEQVNVFTEACTQLQTALGYTFIKHIANTAGIARNPSHQFDMVRLGIGLYGVDSSAHHQLKLQTVATLKTTVAQVRQIPAGETVGYGRVGKVNRDSIIATVRIGYADGYSRRLGNGAGKLYVHGAMAPTVGNICMDMAMIDVTDIPNVKAGDIVEVFGANMPVQELAQAAGTIPYEIMTGISQRVKRVYFEE